MIMTEWLHTTLAQQYEENLGQIRQQLLNSIFEQRRLSSVETIPQYQLCHLTQQLVFQQQQFVNAIHMVGSAHAEPIDIFMAKMKEQKICQEIYAKVLQQLNNNLNYYTLAKHSDGSAVGHANESTVVVGANSAFANCVKYPTAGVSNMLNFSLGSTLIDESTQLSSSNVLPTSPSTSTGSCDALGEMEDSEDNRPYRCTICDKRFRFKSNLFEHKSLHVKSQAFLCPFCGKTCRLKGNLKKHLQVHVNTVENLEKLWKNRFSRSSGRPRKDTPPKPLPGLGDDLGLIPINCFDGANAF